MKFFNRLRYFCREAWLSLLRNRLLTIATISTVTICIFIVGIALLVTLNANDVIARLESDVEMIAFLDTELTEEQRENIKVQLNKLPGVQSLTFVSKEESMLKLQKNINKEDLGEILGTNPLPDSYEIKAADPHKVPEMAVEMSNIYGIYKINYGQGIVEKLFKVTSWIRNLCIGMIGVLAIGAVFLVATCIRLAIFARRKEIYLMKLVGATNWFIRWPFFLEGVLIGSVGSAISLLLLDLGYSSIITNVPNLMVFTLIQESSVMSSLYLSLLLLGIVLGILGTFISLNRFLEV